MQHASYTGVAFSAFCIGAAAVAGGEARGLPCLGPALLLAMSASSGGAGGGARAAGAGTRSSDRSSGRGSSCGKRSEAGGGIGDG